MVAAPVLLVSGQLHPPDHRIGRGVDHLDGRLAGFRVGAEARDEVAFVWRDVHVVDRGVNRNALDDLVRGDVDDVDNRGQRAAFGRLEPGSEHVGRPHGDGGVDLPVFLVDRDLVGPRRQLDLLHQLQRLRIEDVDGPLRFVGAVVIQAVRMDREVVRVRATVDEAHNLVNRRVDDVMDIARVVALEDPDRDALVGVEARDLLCGDGRREENNHADDGR